MHHQEFHSQVAHLIAFDFPEWNWMLQGANCQFSCNCRFMLGLGKTPMRIDSRKQFVWTREGSAVVALWWQGPQLCALLQPLAQPLAAPGTSLLAKTLHRLPIMCHVSFC